MRYNQPFEIDAQGYVLDPEDSRFKGVKLYRGTTLGEVDFGDGIRVTGQRPIAQIWALHYSRNPRFSRHTRYDIVEFLAREFGIDKNADTPVVVTVKNAERYIASLRDLDSSLRSEGYVSLQHARRNRDILLEQVTQQERRWLHEHLNDIDCRMFIPGGW